MNKELTREMIKYLNGDVKRINHMLKVRAFSELIADGEKTDGKIKDILLSAAAVHDIGIHICEKKYGSTAVRQALIRKRRDRVKLVSL